MIKLLLNQFAKGSSGSDGIGADQGMYKGTTKKQYYETHGGSAGGRQSQSGSPVPKESAPKSAAPKSSAKTDTLTNTEIRRSETYVLYQNIYGEDTYSREISGAELYTGRSYYYDNVKKMWRDSGGNRYKVRRK